MSEPYCLAMVLCDAVHRDSATGKHTILGTFSTLASKEFPAPLQLAVYFAITDAQGEYELVFRIVDSGHAFDDEIEPEVVLRLPVSSPSPLAVFEGHFGVQGPIRKAGVYHCELLLNDNVLMSRRLVAVDPTSLEENE